MFGTVGFLSSTLTLE